MRRSDFLKATVLAPIAAFFGLKVKPNPWYKIRQHYKPGTIYGIAMDDIPEGHSGMVRVVFNGDGMREVWLKDDA